MSSKRGSSPSLLSEDFRKTRPFTDTQPDPVSPNQQEPASLYEDDDIAMIGVYGINKERFNKPTHTTNTPSRYSTIPISRASPTPPNVNQSSDEYVSSTPNTGFVRNPSWMIHDQVHNQDNPPPLRRSSSSVSSISESSVRADDLTGDQTDEEDWEVDEIDYSTLRDVPTQNIVPDQHLPRPPDTQRRQSPLAEHSDGQIFEISKPSSPGPTPVSSSAVHVRKETSRSRSPIQIRKPSVEEESLVQHPPKWRRTSESGSSNSRGSSSPSDVRKSKTDHRESRRDSRHSSGDDQRTSRNDQNRSSTSKERKKSGTEKQLQKENRDEEILKKKPSNEKIKEPSKVEDTNRQKEKAAASIGERTSSPEKVKDSRKEGEERTPRSDKETESWKEKEMEKERQVQREKEREVQREKEREVQREKEREVQREKERQVQREKEREVQREKERQVQREKERKVMEPQKATKHESSKKKANETNEDSRKESDPHQKESHRSQTHHHQSKVDHHSHKGDNVKHTSESKHASGHHSRASSASNPQPQSKPNDPLAKPAPTATHKNRPGQFPPQNIHGDKDSANMYGRDSVFERESERCTGGRPEDSLPKGYSNSGSSGHDHRRNSDSQMDTCRSNGPSSSKRRSASYSSSSSNFNEAPLTPKLSFDKVRDMLQRCPIRGCPIYGQKQENRTKSRIHLERAHSLKLCEICFELISTRDGKHQRHFLDVHADKTSTPETAPCVFCGNPYGYTGMYKHLCKSHIGPESGEKRKCDVDNATSSKKMKPEKFDTKHHTTVKVEASSYKTSSARAGTFSQLYAKGSVLAPSKHSHQSTSTYRIPKVNQTANTHPTVQRRGENSQPPNIRNENLHPQGIPARKTDAKSSTQPYQLGNRVENNIAHGSGSLKGFKIPKLVNKK